MLTALKDTFELISILDLIYLIINILSLIKCYKKGFVLSILSMAKWLLALGMLLGRLEVLTVLVLFTRAFWRN